MKKQQITINKLKVKSFVTQLTDYQKHIIKGAGIISLGNAFRPPVDPNDEGVIAC